MEVICVKKSVAYPIFGIAITVLITSIIYMSHILLSSSVNQQTKNEPITEYTYVLKEYEDGIGVYRKNESTPFQQLDVVVDTLPEYDQNALKQGMKVKDDTELRRLIEDYTS